MAHEFSNGQRVRLGREVIVTDATPSHLWVIVRGDGPTGDPVHMTVPVAWLEPAPVESARGLEPGAVVRLKSGGPQMTVDQVWQTGYRCVWFGANNELGSAGFAAHQLVVLFDRDGHPVEPPRHEPTWQELGDAARKIVDERLAPMREAILRDAEVEREKAERLLAKDGALNDRLIAELAEQDRARAIRETIAAMGERTKGEPKDEVGKDVADRLDAVPSMPKVVWEERKARWVDPGPRVGCNCPICRGGR